MNSGCRVTGQFLVLQALLQSLPVALDAWQARLCPDTASGVHPMMEYGSINRGAT
mgnify:CR=1 FL=1